MVQITQFTRDEVSELQRYIEVNVQNTILQKLFALTENPEEKASVFIIDYRILQSCSKYASTQELKDKLNELLKECEEVYYEVYPIVLKYNNIKVEFGKSRIINSIIEILQDKEKNNIINKLINFFLVFGEKIELINIDSVGGIDLENDFGKEILKDVRKVIDKEKI